MDLKFYPSSMINLAALIGEEATLSLIRERGGSVVYVPTQFRSGHWITKLIGVESTELLVGGYGGCTLDIPECRSADIRTRNEEIVRAVRLAGRTTQEVAREFGLSRRMVQRVLAEVGPEFDGFRFRRGS